MTATQLRRSAVLLRFVPIRLNFVIHECKLIRAGAEPLLDLRAVRPPGLLPGLIACFLVMGVYTVFLFTLTQYLHNGLGFTPWRAGLTFVPFAAGFATVSRTWSRLPSSVSRWLPVAGPIAFAAGITTTAVLAADRWPTLAAVVLLAVADAGHAASFSPLFARVARPGSPPPYPRWSTPEHCWPSGRRRVCPRLIGLSSAD